MDPLSELFFMSTTFDIVKTVNEVLQDTEAVILDLNREQLRHGLRSDGKKLKDGKGNDSLSYESITYAVMKAAQNSLPGLFNPDLYLTGSFQNQLFLTASGLISSWDDKTEELEIKYGEEILGLSEASLLQYLPIFVERLRVKIYKELFGI